MSVTPVICCIKTCTREVTDYVGRGLCTKHYKRANKYSLTNQELEDAELSHCEICGGADRLVVDHDHQCCPGPYSCGKCVRGVLCSACNTALGAARDDINILASAIIYLNGG